MDMGPTREDLLERIAEEALETGDLTGRAKLSPRVLEAMAKVPRDRFVRPGDEDEAWADRPLPIGFGQTISQPFVVALMTELLDLAPGDRVLEIGTGSGYQAAVLAELGAEVYTVERIVDLADMARTRLASLGYRNVAVRAGDGRLGWPEHAPYAGIIATAATPSIPPAWREQLAIGGRLVVPLGEPDSAQVLARMVLESAGRLTYKNVLSVVFVPLRAGVAGPAGC